MSIHYIQYFFKVRHKKANLSVIILKIRGIKLLSSKEEGFEWHLL